MPFNNNIYANAASLGLVEGVLNGRDISTFSSGGMDALGDAMTAFATEVDSLIAFDAQVTTSSGTPTQLAITTNTIAAHEQWKAGLLQACCAAAFSNGGWPSSDASFEQLATNIVAEWTTLVALLVAP